LGRADDRGRVEGLGILTGTAVGDSHRLMTVATTFSSDQPLC
jgi:hypothetical protein